MSNEQGMQDENPPAEGLGDTDDAGRRTALRKLAAGLGLVAGGSLIPERWTRPLVESVVSRANAQVTTTSQPPSPTTTTPPA